VGVGLYNKILFKLVMGSGNFLIGKGLSIAGFNEHVKPELESNKITVQDIVVVHDPGKVSDNILVSVVARDTQQDLEAVVNLVLIQVGALLEAEQSELPRVSLCAQPVASRNYFYLA